MNHIVHVSRAVRSKSLEELVRVAKDLKIDGSTEQATLRLWQQMCLVRAFKIWMDNGDFGGFLTDKTCGRYMAELKEALTLINAQQALCFVITVEREFPDAKVPIDDIERWDAFEEIDQRLGGKWLLDLSTRHRSDAEEAADLMLHYAKERLKN